MNELQTLMEEKKRSCRHLQISFIEEDAKMTTSRMEEMMDNRKTPMETNSRKC
ncbi:MAG: hypothetical protein ACLSG9_08360 [Eubacterium sp.]